MAGETRSCSCGTTMAYRLGSYECPGCGRLEQAASSTAQTVKKQTEGSSSSWDPGAQYRTPEARPSSLHDEFRAPVPPTVKPAPKHLWGTGRQLTDQEQGFMDTFRAVRWVIGIVWLLILIFRACTHQY